MQKFLNLIYKLTLSICTFFLLFSCSKDADLLSEYVITKNDDLQSITLLVDDIFFMAPGQNSIMMDVLNNDNIGQNTNVSIIETSTPINGSVTINDDNTLTYKVGVETTPEETTPEETTPEETTPEETTPEETTPEETTPEETTPEEDTFTYTLEVVDEETGTVTQEEAAVTISTSPISNDMGELKAFPGAEGYGKYTTGGRGGYVYHVTNLNEYGSGSLRYGVETLKGARTIVFDVSGYINLTTPIKVRDGYGDLTIAGQTSPGDGITLKNSSFWIHDSNVIVRYIRIRAGVDTENPANLPPSDPDYEPNDVIRIVAWSGTTIENVIIDHCSFSWGRDEIMEIGTFDDSYISNVTVQNSIFSENIEKGHAVIFFKNPTKISFYNNLIAHCSSRIIASNTSGSKVEMINNIIYNFDSNTYLNRGSEMDLIGNVYIAPHPEDRILQTFRLEYTGSVFGNEADTKVFISDNTENDNDITVHNAFLPYIQESKINNSGIIPIPNSSVISTNLPIVGASIYRDDVDLRLVSDVINGTGDNIINENSVGGFPNIESQKRSENYDTDMDGIANFWEIANSLNQNDSSDSQIDGNGNEFSNLERFLHYLTL